ncbi:ABC transporter substrate-binding protein [Sandaracinobacter sp. RS1-74]|uniref:ABC transporter substrate-binding protein n=1 Tax=Sandaracinobacteroides sayramensis TaxID=2913411 RepID=UPI001EDA16D9|nr:ABC transporter substrate-binding protein [Sandaracinobacteroides sayramensis]MCG2840666.1 ABC transporter substrate-binding protein [Sandaracinobacteroides sayramensis]
MGKIALNVGRSEPGTIALSRLSRVLPGIVALGALLLLPACSPQADSAKTEHTAPLVDLRGRPIEIGAPATKIAIDDSRYLVALGLIHPDPVSLLVAWPKDVNRLGEETYRQLLAKSPQLADLPKIGSSAGAFDAESLLAARPDVALLSLESGVTEAQIAQLEQAGIKVVVLDFVQQPLENLENSLLLLGKLTGREQQAKSYIAFRAEHMKRVSDRIAKLPAAARPTVFLEAHAGMSKECCSSPGRGNIGNYIDFVGGHNIGGDVIDQHWGKLNLEYIISRDPHVYIATGGPHLEKAGGLVLGAGYDAETARASLARMAARQGISSLSAVQAGRVHGFSHQLINSPLDIVAVERFATWIHPELFADVDPAVTLDEINNRFLAVPAKGIYWIDLKPEAVQPN